jgi:hypothetical protein
MGIRTSRNPIYSFMLIELHTSSKFSSNKENRSSFECPSRLASLFRIIYILIFISIYIYVCVLEQYIDRVKSPFD